MYVLHITMMPKWFVRQIICQMQLEFTNHTSALKSSTISKTYNSLSHQNVSKYVGKKTQQILTFRKRNRGGIPI